MNAIIVLAALFACLYVPIHLGCWLGSDPVAARPRPDLWAKLADAATKESHDNRAA